MKNVKLFEEFVNEKRYYEFKFKGKTIKVDPSSIEIEDIDMRDYPDFTDAFMAYAEDHKGRELTDAELDAFNDSHYEITNELIHDQQLYL